MGGKRRTRVTTKSLMQVLKAMHKNLQATLESIRSCRNPNCLEEFSCADPDTLYCSYECKRSDPIARHEQKEV